MVARWRPGFATRPTPSVVRPTVGPPIPYVVIRAGAPLTTDVTWAAPSIGRTLLDGWSVVLFSLSFAGIAAFVFARRPDEPAATALMIAACGAAGSSVPWFLGVTVSGVVQGGPFLLYAFITGPLYMLLWPAGLHLALVFPAPLPGRRASPVAHPGRLRGRPRGVRAGDAGRAGGDADLAGLGGDVADGTGRGRGARS